MRGKCVGLITYLVHWCSAILQGLHHNFLFPPLCLLRFRTLLARLQNTSCILFALVYILIKSHRFDFGTAPDSALDYSSSSFSAPCSRKSPVILAPVYGASLSSSLTSSSNSSLLSPTQPPFAAAALFHELSFVYLSPVAKLLWNSSLSAMICVCRSDWARNRVQSLLLSTAYGISWLVHWRVQGLRIAALGGESNEIGSLVIGWRQRDRSRMWRAFARFWWHVVKARDDLSDCGARIFPGLPQIIDSTYSDI